MSNHKAYKTQNRGEKVQGREAYTLNKLNKTKPKEETDVLLRVHTNQGNLWKCHIIYQNGDPLQNNKVVVH